MDGTAVLAKTAKGLEEVKARTHGLAQKLRTLLIMVDGTATAADLIAKFGGVPEVAAALESLLSDGFVEVRGAGGSSRPAAAPAASPAPPMPPPPPAPPAPTTRPTPPVSATQPMPSPVVSPQSRKEALSALSRFLHDHLGPDADFVTGALESARTRSDFLAAAERCAHTVAAARGAAKAQVFRERARAFADAFLGGG